MLPAEAPVTATRFGRREGKSARGSLNSRSRRRKNRTTAQFMPASYANDSTDGMGFSPDGSTLYVADVSNAHVVGFSIATGAVVLDINFCCQGPDGIAVAPANDHEWHVAGIAGDIGARLRDPLGRAGIRPGSLEDALRAAITGMSQWLEQDYGLTPSEIAQVLGTSVQLNINEVADRNAGVVAKLSKQRSTLTTAPEARRLMIFWKKKADTVPPPRR